ncbi:hypothetical protein BZA77DRAFT_385527 [Pyronema omphalodes]|nr:hypothetical protein BZA77DRAFT_385527 [Pyronema omphalodes]
MSGSHSTPLSVGKQKTAVNPSSITSGNAFHASRPRDHPMTTKGHQPGQLSSPKDHIETFHAQCLPAGTAPKDKTMTPNNIENDIGSSIYPVGIEGMPGATSQSVHMGGGHPGSGMTSRELHHDGQQQGKGGKRQREGLVKFGRTDKSRVPACDLGAADPKYDPKQRALDREDVPFGTGPGQRSTKGDQNALDKTKESAERSGKW